MMALRRQQKHERLPGREEELTNICRNMEPSHKENAYELDELWKFDTKRRQILYFGCDNCYTPKAHHGCESKEEEVDG
jgi:hypothetical protein